MEENNHEEIVHNPKTKHKISTIFSILGKILSILLIIALVIIIIRAVIFKRTDVLGYRFYMIMSGSMEPEFKAKDAVIVKEQNEYKVGDIVAFGNGGAVTVHRIIEENEQEQTFKTKGDNNNVEDQFSIKKENIKGKYVAKIPNLGGMILFLQNHVYVIVVAIIVIILLIIIRRVIIRG